MQDIEKLEAALWGAADNLRASATLYSGEKGLSIRRLFAVQEHDKWMQGSDLRASSLMRSSEMSISSG
jgi:hypothetical protein